MTEHALRIVCQHPFDFRRRVSAMCDQELERVFTSRTQVHIGSSSREPSCVKSCCFFHDALLCRAGGGGLRILRATAATRSFMRVVVRVVLNLVERGERCLNALALVLGGQPGMDLPKLRV